MVLLSQKFVWSNKCLKIISEFSYKIRRLPSALHIQSNVTFSGLKIARGKFSGLG